MLVIGQNTTSSLSTVVNTQGTNPIVGETAHCKIKIKALHDLPEMEALYVNMKFKHYMLNFLKYLYILKFRHK